MDDQADEAYSCFRRGLVDIAGRLPLASRSLRRGLKAAEYVLNVFLLLYIVYTKRPNVLHIQWLPLGEAWPSLELWWMSMVRRWETQIVYTVHNVLPHDTGQRYAEAYRSIYHAVDALICHTDKAKEQLVCDFGVSDERVWVIPHGPLSAELRTIPSCQARNQLDIPQETSICVLFGYIRPYKGIEFLLRAWRRVVDRMPNTLLVLAGHGEDNYQQEIEQQIATLELDQHVETRFYFLPEKELSLIVSAADVLLYPYQNITQSGALLTGLTAGKPIVATNVGGFSEVIQDGQTGVLVEYGDAAGMEEELVQLLRDEEKRERFGRAARDMVNTKYSWDTIARQTLKCYRSGKASLS
jgi:glycosyltransferase involved in cell wall biosynthesis